MYVVSIPIPSLRVIRRGGFSFFPFFFFPLCPFFIVTRLIFLIDGGADGAGASLTLQHCAGGQGVEY